MFINLKPWNNKTGHKRYSFFSQQRDQSDCGVVCLQNIVRFYGGEVELEELRTISGTNVYGTTLLGLFQAANKIGFDPEGCVADIDFLMQQTSPSILNILTPENLNHYIICWEVKKQEEQIKFIVGDPACGITTMSKEQLDSVWQSKTCLLLALNQSFVKQKYRQQKKREWLKNILLVDFDTLLIAAVLGILIASIGLTMSIFSQKMIDDIIPTRNIRKFYESLSLVFILLLSRELLIALRQYFLNMQSRNFSLRITTAFFSKLLMLPKTFFDSRKTGDLTARLTDTSRIQRVISQIAGNAIIDLLVVIIIFIYLFSSVWKIALLSLLILPIYFILIYKHKKQISDGQKNIMKHYSIVESNYISTLQGIEAIKIDNKQDMFLANNKNIYSSFQDVFFSFGKIQIRVGVIVNSFGIFILIVILLYCSNLVFNSELKVGQLMAIMGLYTTILPSIASLALVSIPISEAKIAFDRMFEFTGLDPEPSSASSLITKVDSLKVEQLAFRFAGSQSLFINVSFTVFKGECIAIMGENGCGKSTICQILQKNYASESGSIFINDAISLDNISFENWRGICGVVPQRVYIFNTTVLENIAFDDAIKDTQKVIKFLIDYGFDVFIDSLPNSFMTIVGEDGLNLSGGQRQMIGIARALYKNPQLLLLDEATAAMDRESERFSLQLLQKLKSDMGIIFITHRLHVLKSFCDRIYIIEQGVTHLSGTHEQLLLTNNMYSEYWSDFVTD